MLPRPESTCLFSGDMGCPSEKSARQTQTAAPALSLEIPTPALCSEVSSSMCMILFLNRARFVSSLANSEAEPRKGSFAKVAIAWFLDQRLQHTHTHTNSRPWLVQSDGKSMWQMSNWRLVGISNVRQIRGTRLVGTGSDLSVVLPESAPRVHGEANVGPIRRFAPRYQCMDMHGACPQTLSRSSEHWSGIGASSIRSTLAWLDANMEVSPWANAFL